MAISATNHRFSEPSISDPQLSVPVPIEVCVYQIRSESALLAFIAAKSSPFLVHKK